MKDMTRIKLNRQDVIKALKKSNSVSQLARECGCSADKIRTWVRDNGLYELYCKELNIKYVPYVPKKCSICGETKNVHTLKGVPYCKKHYNQMYRKGKQYKTIYDNNDYIIDGDIIKIVLRSKYHKIVGECIIDRENYDKVKNYKWYLSRGYCITKGINPNCSVDIANVMYDDYKNMYDHISNDRLDNRNVNLRPVTSQQNAMNMGKKNTNTSGVTGVSKQKQVVKGERIWSGRWYSCITYEYKNIWLGAYGSFNEAVEARLKGEIKYFKEYAPNYNPITNTISLRFISKDDDNTYEFEYGLDGKEIRKEIIIQ